MAVNFINKPKGAQPISADRPDAAQVNVSTAKKAEVPKGKPANAVLREHISHQLTQPVGRPSLTKVKQFYENFEYQAQSRDKRRRVIAKIEWHPNELFPRVGFIVTNLPMEPDWVAGT